MITKNLIVNQLPEYNNLSSKPIRGLATFTQSGVMSGNIKVFNIREDLLPVSMVVKVGEQKFVFSNIETPQNYDFKISGVSETDDITLLLATSQAGVVTGLAMAHSANAAKDYSALFEEIDQNELDDLIDEELQKEDTLDATSPQKSNETEQNEDDSLNVQNMDAEGEDTPQQQEDGVPDFEPTGNFYMLIQPQLDKLFNKFPHFRELEDLVENTEWIKVNYAQNDSQHYILGKLYDGAVVTHLCYGIPANSRSSAPPESLTDFCQWLPLSLSDPDGEGYWVMYQSAETGENIRL